jgi:hypothetical protein
VVDAFDAFPHWGQFHPPSEAAVFASARTTWQRVIRQISDGNEMFWSDFARARSLLP